MGFAVGFSICAKIAWNVQKISTFAFDFAHGMVGILQILNLRHTVHQAAVDKSSFSLLPMWRLRFLFGGVFAYHLLGSYCAPFLPILNFG
jgi:hypothetical protein